MENTAPSDPSDPLSLTTTQKVQTVLSNIHIYTRICIYKNTFCTLCTFCVFVGGLAGMFTSAGAPLVLRDFVRGRQPFAQKECTFIQNALFLLNVDVDVNVDVSFISPLVRGCYKSCCSCG